MRSDSSALDKRRLLIARGRCAAYVVAGRLQPVSRQSDSDPVDCHGRGTVPDLATWSRNVETDSREVQVNKGFTVAHLSDGLAKNPHQKTATAWCTQITSERRAFGR